MDIHTVDPNSTIMDEPSVSSSGKSAKARTLASREAILDAFAGFRDELDEKHDRRERIVKASRDVTNQSKKVIFQLHRLVGDETNPPSAASHSQAAAKGLKALEQTQKLLYSLAPDLEGSRAYQFLQAVSPGLQEYIEALAFAHFLRHGTLISLAEVQRTLLLPQVLPDAKSSQTKGGGKSGGEVLELGLRDYLLGVSDVTGELMRYAISAIGRRGGRGTAGEVSAFVRNCKADFDGFTPYVKYLGKKQEETARSLQKIEDAAYEMAVRSWEYGGEGGPGSALDIVELCRRGVAAANANGGGGNRKRTWEAGPGVGMRRGGRGRGGGGDEEEGMPEEEEEY